MTQTDDRSSQDTERDGGGPGGTGPGSQPMGDDRPTPGGQERPMTEDEALDEALEETFPTSDPIAPSRIDGPNN